MSRWEESCDFCFLSFLHSITSLHSVCYLSICSFDCWLLGHTWENIPKEKLSTGKRNEERKNHVIRGHLLAFISLEKLVQGERRKLEEIHKKRSEREKDYVYVLWDINHNNSPIIRGMTEGRKDERVNDRCSHRGCKNKMNVREGERKVEPTIKCHLLSWESFFFLFLFLLSLTHCFLMPS